MSSLNLVRATAAAALRGTPETRPLRDDVTAAGLRAELADLVFACGATTDHPLVVRSASLRSDLTMASASAFARLRGLYVTAALRLIVNGSAPRNPFQELTVAFERLGGQSDVATMLAALTGEDRARLDAELRAHVSILTRELGTIAPSWRPRTMVRSAVLVAGGALELRDQVDVMVGTHTSPVASLALLDVTTSPLGPEAERVMRYHALVSTLRTGSLPLRTAMLSSATGERWTVDVTPELLQRAVADIASLSSMAVAA